MTCITPNAHAARVWEAQQELEQARHWFDQCDPDLIDVAIARLAAAEQRCAVEWALCRRHSRPTPAPVQRGA